MGFGPVRVSGSAANDRLLRAFSQPTAGPDLVNCKVMLAAGGSLGWALSIRGFRLRL